MANIGIFGGTFNPIHNTHISIALSAIEQYKLDKVYFIPCDIPPHKQGQDVLDGQIRLELIEAALSDYNKLFVDDFEIKSEGVSYSYLTVTEYKKRYPEDNLFFIMGSDQLITFDSWYKPEIIASLAQILTVVRSTEEESAVLEKIKSLKKTFDKDFLLIKMEVSSVSSSEIRKLSSSNMDIRGFVPAGVDKYIRDHELYRTNSYTLADVKKLLKEMKETLKPSRYEHTVGVTHCIGNLAMAYNYPVYKAMIAGALHDCAKCISDKERIDICKTNGIEITDVEYKNPSLLHGKVGAFWAKKKYGISDNEIPHAITYHTTGCPDMNLLDKLLYVADYIEPGRDRAPKLNELRHMAYVDLDYCLYLIFKNSVEYLKESNEAIDDMTSKTYLYYEGIIKNRKG